MDRKNIQHIEMFTRVVEFGAAHVELFPKKTFAGQSFVQLGAALSNMSEHASGQVTSQNAVRARTKARAAAQQELRAQLQRISDTARAIALDSPGVDDQFRMPPRHRAQGLILSARAFANAAEPLKSAFVEHRLPKSFIEDLHGAVERLETAIQDHVSSKTRRANDRTGIDDNLGQCLKLVKRLDAVVQNTLVNDSPLLAEWTATRRMPRVSSPEPKTPQA